MGKKDFLDLILRRILVERRRGTSIEEMYEIIMAMIKNQKVADGEVAQTPPNPTALG